MSDPSSVLDRYTEVCEELGQEPSPFILKVIDMEREDQILEPKDYMDLVLPGNNHLITNIRLTDDDMRPLYETLKNNAYIHSMDLRYNNIGDTGAEYIAKLLEETVVLRSVNLMCNDIGEAGAKVIAKAFQTNETLVSLKLNGNKIGNKGGMAFAGVLQVNNTLEELDLGDTDQGTESVIALATVLNQNKSIRALNVNRPLLFSHQEETTVHMARMLKVTSTLQELHLQKCDIRDFGAERLSDALIDNSSLKYLDVSCNRITRDGAKHLSKLLKHNTPLQILDLGFNRIEDDGAKHLADALGQFNTCLTHLVITTNQIKGPGVCAIAKAMKLNISLNNVYIWGNNLETPACVAFNELIETERLDQRNTDVKPYVVDGVVYLSEISHGIRRHYYWTPFYGPDVENSKARDQLDF
uniref:Leucine-rich repeat-containing protein 34-like isoform X2 n=1 Tax=Saccoglossus kowalevskii TaxID=10224 RepID=A0ABM0M5N2_SACKO|nr:PREDICTED: leucine-rich repeat-containing protein 34-like isoform X2 [Saccoglossus kowalevskii]